MNDGWIKLHPKLLKSDVAGDPVGLAVWVWCLLKANREPQKWRGMTIEAGQFVTGREAGAFETGLSQSGWYKVMSRLEKYGYLEQKRNNKGTLVTIKNWGTYQSRDRDEEQQSNNQVTTTEQPGDNHGTSTEQPSDTNKKLRSKEVRSREEREGARTRFVPPTIDDVERFCREAEIHIDAARFVDHYEAVGWKVGGKSPMKNWKAAVRNWHRRDLENGQSAKPKYPEDDYRNYL